MTALRILFSVMFLSACAPGCSKQQVPSEVPTPSAQLPTRTLRDPLTESEVQTFLSVMQSLPQQQLPEFEPLAQVTASRKSSAAQLVGVYRQEYRAMFDASRHGQRWRQNDELTATLLKHNVTPEDFAALVIRMSCAITANSIGPQIDLKQVAEKADADVAQLAAQIDQRDRNSPMPTAADDRHQALESLQNLVAYSEFTRILLEVPADSRRIVEQHRSQLARHVPRTGNVEPLEQAAESDLVPTSFQQPRPSE